jgi:hypothetical protein
MITPMVARKLARQMAAVTLAAGLAVSALAGCSGEGSTSSCSTSQCTITFQRNVENAKISILGIEVQVVSATNDTVTLKVAGQEVNIDKGQGLSVGDFQVQVQEITDSEIIVQVSRGAG